MRYAYANKAHVCRLGGHMLMIRTHIGDRQFKIRSFIFQLTHDFH